MVKNVTKHEGDYKCHITNDAGETSDEDAEPLPIPRQRKPYLLFNGLKLM